MLFRSARLDLREEREDDRNGRCGTRSWVLAIRGAYLGGGWPAGCACAGRFLFRRKKGGAGKFSIKEGTKNLNHKGGNVLFFYTNEIKFSHLN